MVYPSAWQPVRDSIDEAAKLSLDASNDASLASPGAGAGAEAGVGVRRPAGRTHDDGPATPRGGDRAEVGTSVERQLAIDLSWSARSVRSQGRSRSSRPKWPYAAVGW